MKIIIEHAKEEFEKVTICVLNMAGSFIIAICFTFFMWIFNLIMSFAGLGNTIPLILIQNFAEFEGVCFVIVFVLANIFNIIKTYIRPKEKSDH